ncbi:M61 family metallopeptidase [Hymenobacter defluvii]|uniref:M61 family metallopeptidase n=1 Tax=Hymenobacter defluvii TaxID=2054411 RepID=A0ABS3T9I1_9BACT|nr:M61 family metallopeptidase [Hymenobacter defluvii]MBO3270294.1 M61 family metallopeptidase [Hymenobacter defluvii]
MIHYYLSFENPLTSYLQVQLTLEVPTHAPQPLELQLPAWRPGRYELQNFAQKLQRVEVEDAQSGEALPYRKITKDRWTVANTAGRTVRVRYNFYAHQMDAGGSWLDESQLYLNPVQALLYAEGRQQEPCQLQLALPDAWHIACGLPQSAPDTLAATSFDQLVDAPLIASPTLLQRTYEVQGIPFHIWIQGACVPDWPQIIKAFGAFTEENLAVFGGDFPVSDYHFLNQILPYKHYHGVEHHNSTVITLGPAELLMTPSLYKELLGVSCHELFHTWNVKSIRPAEMQPYDFTKENYFRTCYIAEGVTTYYGDYLLARSGIFSAAQYFTELNGVLHKHFDNYGHQNLSLADASMDLWLDGYKPGAPDRKVSVYHKGALVALLLDLTLRQLSQHQRSLDDVMRRLYEDFGKTGVGYTEEDYQQVVREVAGRDMQTYFDKFVYGTAPLEESLNKALRFVGCTLCTVENGSVSEGRFGFRAAVRNERTEVTDILPGTPAADALALEDEIVAVNGRRVTQNLQTLLSTGTGRYELAVFRQNQLRTVMLLADGTELYWAKRMVEKLPDATAEQRASFRQWLKQEF